MKVHSTLNFAYEHTVNKVMHPPQNIFDIYSTDRAKKIGTLICHKSEIPLRPDYEGSVLAVDFIEVNRPNKGFGTKILKFAEDYSREIGCKGYLTLKADSSFTPNKIPHTFYRRFGVIILAVWEIVADEMRNFTNILSVIL